MGLDVGTGLALSGGSSLLGGMFGKNAAQDASRLQANAANNAANLQALGFQYNAQQLRPYSDLGPNLLLNPYSSAINNIYPQINSTLAPIANQLYDYNNLIPTQYTTAQSMTPVNQTIGVNSSLYAPPTTTMGGLSQWGLGADQQKALEQTPGYQFTLNQGLNATQNAAAAQGRGVSGNALANAAQYATGLANNTFNQQYQNMLSGQNQAFNQNLQSYNQWLNSLQQAFNQQYSIGNYNLAGQNQGFNQALAGAQLHLGTQNQLYNQMSQNIYNPINTLYSGLQLGANAAGGLGNSANTAANNIGNSLIGGANAQASGIVGGTNALLGGVGNANNLLMNYMLMSQLGLLGGGGGGYSYSGGYSPIMPQYGF